MDDQVVCSGCGRERNDVELNGREHPPCPDCGSKNVTVKKTLKPGHLTLKGQLVEIRIDPVWDSLSLTLAGVLWGVVVAVGAVLVANLAIGWRIGFAAVALGVVVVGLFFPRPVILAMRKLLQRATRR